jgi:D-cysteine desulfhydrase
VSFAPVHRSRPLLFSALPELSLPWTPLAHAPTPVERMTAIQDWLGPGQHWMKRDDRISPLYGGNKVRRYEFVLADAKARGKSRIVTAGGIASTQAMATALFGRALGFRVHLVLFDQPITRFAKRALLVDADAGAELEWGGGYVTTAARTTLALFRERKASELILPGAANPLANLGYVDAMLELDAQVRAGQLPRPDAIVLPTGSSGTLAALALGAAHLGWATEIIGVRITTALATNAFTVSQVMGATDRFLTQRAPRSWRPRRKQARWSLDGSALGAGYGHPTAEALEAIPEVEKLLGVPGEVTYSAKVLAAFRRLARLPRWKGKTLLFWCTLSSVSPEPAADAASKVPASLRWVLDAPEVA